MTTDVLERPTTESPAPLVTTTRIRLRHLRYVSTGQLWTVRDDSTGEIIVDAVKDPEFEAARVLVARGVTGTMETYTGDRDFPSFRMDVEKAAKLMTVENRTDGPRLAKWRPNPMGRKATADD